jgi:hypothetical protein
VTIRSQRRYFWCAVDEEDEVIDIHRRPRQAPKNVGPKVDLVPAQHFA